MVDPGACPPYGMRLPLQWDWQKRCNAPWIGLCPRGACEAQNRYGTGTWVRANCRATESELGLGEGEQSPHGSRPGSTAILQMTPSRTGRLDQAADETTVDNAPVPISITLLSS